MSETHTDPLIGIYQQPANSPATRRLLMCPRTNVSDLNFAHQSGLWLSLGRLLWAGSIGRIDSWTCVGYVLNVWVVHWLLRSIAISEPQKKCVVSSRFTCDAFRNTSEKQPPFQMGHRSKSNKSSHLNDKTARPMWLQHITAQGLLTGSFWTFKPYHTVFICGWNYLSCHGDNSSCYGFFHSTCRT